VADGIRVETDGLNKFSGQVQDDTTQTLESGYSAASVDLSGGVQFGVNNASGSVYAAKQRYVDSLQVSTANIEGYMRAARLLAAAAANVASEMDKTDGQSAERVNSVREAMIQAVLDSQRERGAPLDGHPTTRTGGAEAAL
jgi:hypothetical protein